jgi:hypothetical protein
MGISLKAGRNDQAVIYLGLDQNPAHSHVLFFHLGMVCMNSAIFLSGVALGLSLGIAMGIGVVMGGLMVLAHFAMKWAGRE